MPIENNQDLRALTQAMHEFVTNKGWYNPTSKRVQSPRSLAISLSIEATEVLELFQWGEEVHNAQELASELAEAILALAARKLRRKKSRRSEFRPLPAMSDANLSSTKFSGAFSRRPLRWNRSVMVSPCNG